MTLYLLYHPIQTNLALFLILLLYCLYYFITTMNAAYPLSEQDYSYEATKLISEEILEEKEAIIQQIYKQLKDSLSTIDVLTNQILSLKENAPQLIDIGGLQERGFMLGDSERHFLILDITQVIQQKQPTLQIDRNAQIINQLPTDHIQTKFNTLQGGYRRALEQCQIFLKALAQKEVTQASLRSELDVAHKQLELLNGRIKNVEAEMNSRQEESHQKQDEIHSKQEEIHRLQEELQMMQIQLDQSKRQFSLQKRQLVNERLQLCQQLSILKNTVLQQKQEQFSQEQSKQKPKAQLAALQQSNKKAQIQRDNTSDLPTQQIITYKKQLQDIHQDINIEKINFSAQFPEQQFIAQPTCRENEEHNIMKFIAQQIKLQHQQSKKYNQNHQDQIKQTKIEVSNNSTAVNLSRPPQLTFSAGLNTTSPQNKPNYAISKLQFPQPKIQSPDNAESKPDAIFIKFQDTFPEANTEQKQKNAIRPKEDDKLLNHKKHRKIFRLNY